MAEQECSSLLKTPTSQLAINGGSQHPDKRKAGGHGPTLADEVEHLLPTPAVNDMGEGKTPEAWDEWTDKMQASHANGNGHGKSLAIEAMRLLPTPTSQAAKHAADDRGTGTLDDCNLWSIVARIGETTNPPSDAGKPSSDDPPPHPPSPDEPATHSSRPCSSPG
jgi:DNA (cytosine-5)-methyltransferase 1